jgi:hypothetical protein
MTAPRTYFGIEPAKPIGRLGASANLPAIVAEPGSALEALKSPKQRAFVLVLAETGLSHAKCAQLAGYEANSDASFNAIGWSLLRKPAVLAALHEVSWQRMKASSVVAIKTVEEAMLDATDWKDKLTAAKMILERTGFSATTHHLVDVQHHDDSDLATARSLVAMARSKGKDPLEFLALLGHDKNPQFNALVQKVAGGPVTDADFTEVYEDEDPAEDPAETLNFYPPSDVADG